MGRRREAPPRGASPATRLRRLDWEGVESELRERGSARVGRLLDAPHCRELIRMWEQPERFRSRVVMARHRFGEGEYRYFAAPLPPLVQRLRLEAYAHLAPLATRWSRDLREPVTYPEQLRDFQAECAHHGQTRPTPLLLRYEAGGYNCLHQDLYGEVAFPFQLVILLSRPGRDFEGGELVLVEQRPRSQSAAEAITLERGEALVFANRARPAEGKRGYYRAPVRHGVSRVRSGTRFALGIIFHDAA